MAGLQETEHAHQIAFEAFGVQAAVGANRPELMERLRPLLPPGWRPCSPSTIGRLFTLSAEESGTYTFAADESTMGQGLELELALMIIESQVRLYVGAKSPEAVFIHAGVVAHDGRTLVMPGSSFAGKTTLVAALVDSGATYYSDEFAVIDERGRVHPYAKPLSVRADGREQTEHSMESLGWTAGSEPLPLDAIVVTTYRPGGEWRPRRLSAGEGALALLSHAVPARERPSQVMPVISRAADDAIAIESERGEADELAPLLLSELDRLTA